MWEKADEYPFKCISLDLTWTRRSPPSSCLLGRVGARAGFYKEVLRCRGLTGPAANGLKRKPLENGYGIGKARKAETWGDSDELVTPGVTPVN